MADPHFATRKLVLVMGVAAVAVPLTAVATGNFGGTVIVAAILVGGFTAVLLTRQMPTHHPEPAEEEPGTGEFLAGSNGGTRATSDKEARARAERRAAARRARRRRTSRRAQT
jgi:hypothetical protein